MRHWSPDLEDPEDHNEKFFVFLHVRTRRDERRVRTLGPHRTGGFAGVRATRTNLRRRCRSSRSRTVAESLRRTHSCDVRTHRAVHPGCPGIPSYRCVGQLENPRALVDQLQAHLVLVEDARIDSPVVDIAGQPASANSGIRRNPQPSLDAEQMGAFAHMAAEFNSARRGARQMEQTTAERSPGAPSRGPGATVPPGASGAQERSPTSAVTSRSAEDIKPTADAKFTSETQALPYASGSMRQP